MDPKLNPIRIHLNEITDSDLSEDEIMAKYNFRPRFRANIKHLKPFLTQYQKLETDHDWFIKTAKKGTISYLDEKKEQFRLISSSFDSEHTHAGLIHYFHYCWAKELGCVLRPDMVWYTIISNLTEVILKNPETFRHLFTESQEKQDLEILPQPTLEALVNHFIKKLETHLPNLEFAQTIYDISFESAPQYFEYALKTTFLCMATPYYNMNTSCGLPFIEIYGSLKEWRLLYNRIVKLFQFMPTQVEIKLKEQRKGISHIGDILNYFNTCRDIVGNIIFYLWDEKNADFTLFDYPDSQAFFQDIFHYGLNKKCFSGHFPTIVSGWLRKLYLNRADSIPKLFGNNKTESIRNFPGHINFLPWKEGRTTPNILMVGLTHSILEKENLAVPYYGYRHYRILDDELYNFLSSAAKKPDQYSDMSDLMNFLKNQKDKDPKVKNILQIRKKKK